MLVNVVFSDARLLARGEGTCRGQTSRAALVSYFSIEHGKLYFIAESLLRKSLFL